MSDYGGTNGLFNYLRIRIRHHHTEHACTTFNTTFNTTTTLNCPVQVDNHRATVFFSSRSTLRDSNSKKQQTIPQQHRWKHNNMVAHCVAPLSATQTSLPANSIFRLCTDQLEKRHFPLSVFRSRASAININVGRCRRSVHMERSVSMYHRGNTFTPNGKCNKIILFLDYQ